RGAFRGQKIIKASSIVGAPLSIDDEAGACLVADIPVDCGLRLDAGWQVELKASALEGDRVAAWQATGTGHVAAPGAPLRHRQGERHAARPRDIDDGLRGELYPAKAREHVGDLEVIEPHAWCRSASLVTRPAPSLDVLVVAQHLECRLRRAFEHAGE